MDIPSFVRSLAQAGKLKTIEKRLSPVLAASAEIRGAEPAPVLLTDVGGARVAANLFPDRDALARGLGVDPRRFLPELGGLLSGKTKRRGAGSRHSDEVYGEVEVPLGELEKLPFLTYYQGDGGPFLTSGVWIVRDPVLGVNLSYHRMMIAAGARQGTVRVVENRGTHTALKNSGGKLDASICIGAPVEVLFAASLSPAPDVNEMDLAALLGRVDLVRCKTVDLEVPAACELVIEGTFTGAQGREGPFVDITGTVDLPRRQPVFRITRVARRQDPLHYAIVPGRADHRVLMGVPKELDMFRAVGQVCRVLDVRVTPGGCCWLHAVIRIDKRKPGDGPRAIAAAFAAHRSLKHCVVVDADVDAGDPADVEWAVATRFQADKDLVVLSDQPASSLDPSACHFAGAKSRGAKMGLDATIKRPGERKLFMRVTA